MKNLCIHYVLGLILMVSPLSVMAQARQSETLALGTIPAYRIEVTYDKTSHVIFPSGIRYVDLGSDYIGIHDRRSLEDRACGCYSRIKKEIEHWTLV